MSEEHDGSRVPAGEAGTLEVHLRENPTTGYLWSVADAPEGVVLVADGFDSGGDQPGAGGRHRFRFEVDPEARGALLLELRRPWESAPEPEGRYRVELA